MRARTVKGMTAAELATDTRWIRYAHVAEMIGVSRQALYGRIQRGTLESMEELIGTGATAQKTILVRPCDAIKRRSGGRPKGNRTESDRKGAEEQRRIRARMYWRKKLLYGQDMPSLLSGLSKKMIEQERKKYVSEMAETVDVEFVET